MGGVWSGDVDLNDGQLQELYQNYTDRQKFINSLNLGNDNVCTHLDQEKENLKCDLEFITESKNNMHAMIMYTCTYIMHVIIYIAVCIVMFFIPCTYLQNFKMQIKSIMKSCRNQIT